MSSSSARGQTEPIAALLAVFVIGAGLALYAGVLQGTLDRESNRDVAAATLERVEDHLTPEGVVVLDRLRSVSEITPRGYETNVTLAAGDQQWSVGPRSAPGADRASKTVSVRTAPASIESGRLRVEVWK